jgi:hypothetical protein
MTVRRFARSRGLMSRRPAGTYYPTRGGTPLPTRGVVVPGVLSHRAAGPVREIPVGDLDPHDGLSTPRPSLEYPAPLSCANASTGSQLLRLPRMRGSRGVVVGRPIRGKTGEVPCPSSDSCLAYHLRRERNCPWHFTASSPARHSRPRETSASSSHVRRPFALDGTSLAASDGVRGGSKRWRYVPPWRTSSATP